MPEELTAGEAARLIGVAITTLRTWDRRYGLGPGTHEAGKHRRYGPEDIRRLVEMQRLITQGIPPARAAAWVLARAAPPAEPYGSGPGGSGSDDSGPGGSSPDSGPDGGGSDAMAVRGLIRAALRLDAAALRRQIGEALAAQGVVRAWSQLFAPALIQIGHKHAATRGLVEVEHLLSGEVSRGLAAIARPMAPARTLLACSDEEQHSLAMEALGAALAEAGIGARLLGARVPPSALRDAIRRAGPEVVVLWSQTAQTADREQLEDAVGTRPAPKLVLAVGPGWHGVDLPDGVRRPSTLYEAVTAIAEG
jgi:DNA-binding transcriptional MerR regulator